MSAEKGNQSSPPLRKEEEEAPSAGGGGWGGWAFSLSVLSDLQKVASTAAEEISRSAVAVAKSITDMETATASDPDPIKEEGDGVKPQSSPGEAVAAEEVITPASETPEERLRWSALDRLEKASEDSLLGQGLKVIDNSVETFASGAWQALGNAWKGSSTLVHKLEHSAANIADSMQQSSLPVTASSLAPSIMETGKSFTAKGMQVLERVGKETMELLITETGFELDKSTKEVDEQAEFEESTFERCFYIYGGPDQLEELEALSNHYALLFNRRKAKLLSEHKSFYDGKLKQVQKIFILGTDIEVGEGSNKGKSIEAVDDFNGIEMKILRDSSVSKAADMAAGFTAALGGFAANEIIQRTNNRLEIIHSEGVHRISELCCFTVSQLLTLGKSIISNANKSKTEQMGVDVKFEWPEDSVSKAKIIRSKAQSMSGEVEAVSNSFVTGISDVLEAYVSAIQSASSDKHDGQPQKNPVQEKADTISNRLRADQTTALSKIQEALQYLAYVVLSTSMPST